MDPVAALWPRGERDPEARTALPYYGFKIVRASCTVFILCQRVIYHNTRSDRNSRALVTLQALQVAGVSPVRAEAQSMASAGSAMTGWTPSRYPQTLPTSARLSGVVGQGAPAPWAPSCP